MSQWIPVIIFSAIYTFIFIWAWISIGRGRYNAGFKAGWMRHVGSHRYDDSEFDQGFIGGWCALLETLDTLTPGWQAREDEYRNNPKAQYEQGRTDGWHEALDAMDPYAVNRRFPL
jgi:hypothetical protein